MAELLIPIGAILVQEDGIEIGPMIGLNFMGSGFDLVDQGSIVGVRLSGAAGFVPSSRIVAAGAGLVGGGDLSADRIFDVVANADGSIVVGANDLGVGILATDAQHGIRGGGTQHAVVTALAAGFMSPAMLAALTALATNTSSILLWGNLNVGTTTTPRFLTPGYDSVAAPTTDVQFEAPQACTLDRLRLRARSGGTTGAQDITYTVRINNANTLLAVTMPATSLAAQNLVDSIAVAAGSQVVIRVTKPGGITTSPTDVMASVRMIGA
jgi:hypothetical protein